MSTYVSLFQSRESLGLGDYIKYTVLVANIATHELEGATLKTDIPHNLLLERGSVFVSDNANTYRRYPYNYDRGSLEIDLPTIPQTSAISITYVLKKCFYDYNIDTYENEVKVDGEKSNTVVAQNRCNCHPLISCR